MRGRRPKPVALHVLDGTYRHDRHADTPKAEIGASRAPRDLDKRARIAWHYYAPILSKMRILTKADREALTCYCVAAGRRAQAEAELSKHGPVVKSPSGYPIQNPWLAIANKAMEQMLKWGQELGLSPASRCRIKLQPDQSEADPMKKLISAMNARQGGA